MGCLGYGCPIFELVFNNSEKVGVYPWIFPIGTNFATFLDIPIL